MTRTPLRPLARILSAREKGENPDHIERENLRLRHEQMRDRSRLRAEGRLLVLGIFFSVMFALVGLRMGELAATQPVEPRAEVSGAEIAAQRADITDRNGRVLATNLATYSLYAQPRLMVDPEASARTLAAIFPDLDADALKRRFTDGRKFLWIKRKLSPEQMQAVHDIGDPGLLFGPREMRLYPNGRLAAHVLGGAGFGREGVHAAEVIGTAGVEKSMDGWLRDPANSGAPLQLSLDMTLQAVTEEVLGAGVKLMNAKGAAAILMDVKTGEVLSLASLPDFDPNNRPQPLIKGDPADSPLFNRAVQGVYELGSTFKIFTAAQAMDLGLVNPDTMIEAKSPMVWGKYKIREFEDHNYGPKLSTTNMIVKSSNVAAAKLALQIGGERQQAFLKSLGLFAPTAVELVEAPGAAPIVPKKWPEITTITVSYGHGLSASPLHLAAAYGAIANGGVLVRPTLLKGGNTAPGTPVMRRETAERALKMLRLVVTEGTATLGDVPGYAVAGKTGTADKPNPQGGYFTDKVVNTFASIFPATDPRYVLVVTLDEPVDNTGPKPKRTAGWTAVPVAAEIIKRVAPLMGLRPEIAVGDEVAVTLARN